MPSPSLPDELLPNLMSFIFSPTLTSRSSIALYFIFKHVILFKVIFIEDVQFVDRCNFEAHEYPVVSAPFVENNYLFPIVLFLLICQRSGDYISVSLFLASVFYFIDLYMFLAIPYCIDCYSLIAAVSHEIG
jgi:hypothetical protein